MSTDKGVVAVVYILTILYHIQNVLLDLYRFPVCDNSNMAASMHGRQFQPTLSQLNIREREVI